MAKKTGIKLTGMDKVVTNINREIKGIENRSQAGLLEAALLIKERAVKRTPVDTGNLRASAYVDSGMIPFKGPWALIGFTAFYAPFVHEINKNYKKGSWKFLESAMSGARHMILRIIQRRARIK